MCDDVLIFAIGRKRRSGKRAPTAGARLGEESPRIGPDFLSQGELYAMSAGHLMTPGPAWRESLRQVFLRRQSIVTPRSSGADVPAFRAGFADDGRVASMVSAESL